MMKNKRFLAFNPSTVEIREGTDKEPTQLTGLAVPYNSWSQPIYGYFREQFKPGAFRSVLEAKQDVICCYNHDWDKLLGRTAADTLFLSDGDEGLRANCSLDNTTHALDTLKMVRRGDIRGMSFVFESVNEEWGKTDGMPTRTITEAKLYEVSFVVNPAYQATSAGARSTATPDECKSWMEERLAELAKNFPIENQPDWRLKYAQLLK